MPKFKSLEHAHKVHSKYSIDTDAEGKYDLTNPYRMQKNRTSFILNAVPHYSHVLEVGCNSGGLMRLLMSENKCYCNGIDISSEMVDRAKEKHLVVYVAEAEKIPYEDNKFDCVLMTEIIEHLYNPLLALKEASRVLKNDGIFVGTVPHDKSYNSTRKDVEKHEWHHTIFTEQSILELLQKAFKQVYTENISWYNDQENKPQWIGFVCKEKK